MDMPRHATRSQSSSRLSDCRIHPIGAFLPILPEAQQTHEFPGHTERVIDGWFFDVSEKRDDLIGTPLGSKGIRQPCPAGHASHG